MVPVENSTEGVVTHTLDMFVDSDLKIVSQIVLADSAMPGEQQQAARKSKKLYSHPQPIAQCRQAGLQMHMANVELMETSSNARAAELAARRA